MVSFLPLLLIPCGDGGWRRHTARTHSPRDIDSAIELRLVPHRQALRCQIT